MDGPRAARTIIAPLPGRRSIATLPPVSPGPLPSASDDEMDLSAAATPTLARITGGLGLLSGVITALTAVQTLTMVHIRGLMAYAPWALLLLGLATAYAGARLMGGHGWAAIASTSLNALLFLLTGGWLVYSFLHGLFSLFAFFDPMLAFIAGGLSIACIDLCARVSAARKKLADEGLGLGLGGG